MQRKVIIMGGSFNPPTIAHYLLMQAAMQAIGADQGIFVPVSKAYLRRKMRRAEAPLCLSESLRLEMLKAMCADDPRMTFSDMEMRDPTLYTEQTMQKLQQENPDARLYFLAGADKMPLIQHWAQKTDFLDRFRVAIVCREGVDPMQTIRQDADMCRYEASFSLVAQPQGVEQVSSTAIRRHFAAGQSQQTRPFLHPSVWELFSQLKPEDYPPEIERFQKEYEFLSNSYPIPVQIFGLTFRNAEAAFQAARCENPADRKRFLTCDGGGAKSIGAKVTPRADWETEKLAVMEDVLRKKFTQNPELARKLAETGNANLTFGNNGKDPFWGMDLYTCQGENHLGQLLMKLRRELRQ